MRMTALAAGLLAALISCAPVAAQTIRINQLPAATSGAPGDYLPCVQSGSTRACTSAQVVAGGGAALTANNLGDLPSPSAARTNLGLGSAATQPLSYFLATTGGALSGPLTVPSVNGVNVGNVATGLYQDANNIALRAPTSTGAVFFQNAGASATYGSISSSLFSLTVPFNSSSSISAASGSFGGILDGLYATTNGQSRKISAKLADVASVKDFGAVGNDTADDTAAIQQAINVVGSMGGGTVYFPGGTYKISSGLNIAYSNVTLQGTGTHGSVLDQQSTTVPCTINMGSASTASRAIQVRALGISAPTNATAGANICMSANNSEMSVHDVWMHGGFDGIDMDSAATNSVIYQVDNIYIQNPQGYGIRIGSGNDPGTLQEIQIGQTTVAGCGLVCVEIENVSGLYTEGLSEIVSYGGDGIRFNTAGPHGQALFVFMKTTLSDSNSSGHGWEFTGAGPIAHFECTACWSSANGLQGVLINSSAINGWSWNGGVIRSNAYNGLLLNAGSNIAVLGANVCDNNQSNSGTYTGVNIANGTSLFRVENSTLGSCGYETQHSGANYQTDGILINTGSNHYVVSNNLTVGNVNVGVVDNANGANSSVTGNVS